MELTPEQLRDVHDMANLTIAESELPRVVRERDALLAALRPFAMVHTCPEPWHPLDEDYRRAAEAIALCEQPQPERQPCPTTPTDRRPKS